MVLVPLPPVKKSAPDWTERDQVLFEMTVRVVPVCATVALSAESKIVVATAGKVAVAAEMVSFVTVGMVALTELVTEQLVAGLTGEHVTWAAAAPGSVPRRSAAVRGRSERGIADC
jgi:hypothetical protein